MMKKIFRRKDKGGKAKLKDDRAKANDEDLPHAATSPTAAGSEVTETNEYSKYGIASPPKYTKEENTQRLELEKAEQAIRKDGFENYLKALGKTKSGETVYSDEATVLVYLYDRGFFNGKKNVEERKQKVKKLLRSKKAMTNLLKLAKLDGDRDDTATNRQLYINTKVALERYLEQPGAFSFLCGHHDNAAGGKKPILYCRTQAHGNCFIYGPCMTNSYLLQRHDCNLDANGLDLGVVDVQKYIRRTFSDQELYEYVLTDIGGESASTFETILKATTGETPRLSVGSPEVFLEAKSLQELLSKYGPGLVSRFAVSGHFHDGGARHTQNKIGVIRFTGKNIEKARGRFVPLDGNVSDERNVEVELEQHLQCLRVSDPRKKLFASANCVESIHDSPGSLGKATASTNKETAKTKKVEGKHAVVLIGGRYDASEKKDYFLLQNWWSNMQLVEVDLDYLEECGAILCFAKPENFDDVDAVNLEECYSMNRYKVADAYNLDRADTDHGCVKWTPRERMI